MEMPKLPTGLPESVGQACRAARSATVHALCCQAAHKPAAQDSSQLPSTAGAQGPTCAQIAATSRWIAAGSNTGSRRRSTALPSRPTRPTCEAPQDIVTST